MKKFLVGILSVFLLFGASIISACTSSSTTLTLSKETVEIQIYAGEDEGYQIVTAEVEGTDKASISANAKSGYENIVKVTTTAVSGTKANIKIEGLNEGYAEIQVKSGSQTKYIHATVYSEVSEMSQKTEDGEKKNNFLIRGQENILNEVSLIEFTPSDKSRRTITWSLTEEVAGVTLNENSLTIGNDFIGDTLSLIATTEKGVTTEIILPVIDKIENEINLGFSYSKNSTFEDINEENKLFNIVPNVATDEKYQAYVLLDYVGDLDITSYVYDSNGNVSNDIVVNRDGSIDERPVFIIHSNKEKTNINGTYTIGFKIGYKEYNYALDTKDICPITIEAREMVNGVIISAYGSGNIENSTQTLYTEYGESEYSTIYGQQFDIMMIPTTVIGATNRYSITLSREEAGGAIADGCPIEIWYRDVVNGNVWTFLALEEDDTTGNYVVKGDVLPSMTTLYIKASETIKEQTISGLKLTFTSEDNKNISSSFNLKLVKSVSAVDFKFPDGAFKIDSSVENQTYKKQFTLKGQTTTEGLYILNNSKAVTFDEIHYISSDTESVTFEVSLSLKKASYGVTTLDSYQIAHRNGLVSEKIDIDIFLPLKEAGIYIDTANNKSNSIVDTEYSKKTYSTIGEVLDKNNESLSALMLKNNTTTPLLYSYNQINGISAVANIKVEYYDFNAEEDDISRFIALGDTDQGVLEIINKAKGSDSSNIAYFTGDYSSIITKGVGHTYAVMSFTGKSTTDEGSVTLVRILKLESLVTPEGMNITPNTNKNVTLYSMESLATSDENLTKQEITIKFVESNVTYKDVTNVMVYSRNEVMGEMSISGDGSTVSWANGRYTVSNITLTNEGITFTISALHTFGEYIFTDTLDVHYIIKKANEEKVYDISTSIKITINNAQRIESVTWDNYDADGLYFEIGENNPQYMVFKTTPSNAKNKNMAYVITDKEGSSGQTFVQVSNAVSSGTLSVNISNKLTEGMTGYIYILPADAIYNNQIKYYYMENGKEKSGYISPSSIGEVINNEGLTNYDYLIENAYFKSNSINGVSTNVGFDKIVLKVKITVADGKSFEHAYRIYDEEGFNTLLPDRYYTVMTSLDLSDYTRSAINNFAGGLQGYNSDVTIKLNGSNFAQTIGASAEIRNIKFNGNVESSGFVADTNKGKITNVTVDVDGISASTLTVYSTCGGGIVGINNGTIDGAKVLGLDIAGSSTSTIGGIAGQNAGIITNSAVEFYNLYTGKNSDGTSIYGSNKFVGKVIGAIVGEISPNSSISYSYAYDYTLTSGSESVIQYNEESVDAKSGAIAGTITYGFAGEATINYSFAVVGLATPYYDYINDTTNVVLTNYYIGYYSSGKYYVIPSDLQNADFSNSNFVLTTDENFDSEVNGGYPYLKELQQSQRITTVDYNVATVENNGYYKSVEVNSDNGILFYYALKDSFVELNSAEQNDLTKLNTITLAQLVNNESVSENIIITSSNISIAKVVGSSIILRKTGDVELTLSSKQDVTLNKTIKVKVVSPLSNMFISWTDSVGNENYIQENSQLSIQKTRSRDFSISFYRPNVYLGTLANSYDIIENNYDLTIAYSTEEEGNANAVEAQKISNRQFKLLSSNNSVLTTFKVSTTIFENEEYQNAINNEFSRDFKVLPTEGVISFAISSDTLTISPSINASVKAEIKSTDISDSVYPEVSLNGNTLARKSEGNVHSFTILGENTPILEAVVTQIDKQDKDGVTTYVFDVNFGIAEGYKSNIAEEYEFDAYLMSTSGNSSKEWKGSFSILVSQQEFTNIDVSNKKVESVTYQSYGSSYIEVFETEEVTAVLAPGNTSILQVNVNPEYAYYDYVEFTYSGATVSNAVNVVIVEPYNNSDNQFIKKAVSNNNIETINSKLVYRPNTTNGDNKSTIFYKLWINTTVNRDTTLKFTATFYNQNNEVLDFVNYYLTVSYLTEQTITVDGASTTYLAKGSSAEIKIDVLLDQKVDSLVVEGGINEETGEGIEGISVSQLSAPIIDSERGIKTYTAKVYASVLAKTGDRNTFYLRARVSRELNGAKEIKDSIATVVIVDFKIDTNSITIANTKDNNLTIWQGVSKPFMVEYDLLPESYPYPSTSDMADAIQKLRSARDSFEKNEYYPLTNEEAKNSNYLVNYVYDKESGNHIKQSLKDRLFVVVNNEHISLSDTSVEKPFEVIEALDSTISFKGTRISGQVKMVLKTYVTAGYVTTTIETPFTITVEAYSDPDLPIKISSAADFNNLNPDLLDSGVEFTANDYILENDILLENYTAFDTDLISSLDGNGHTIFIKSFNFDTTSNVLNLALFNTIKEVTTLKNVRVNVYNGGQLTINVSQFKTISIAGLAIENAGVITNSEVVSFYTADRAVGTILSDAACTLHNKLQGINVNYVNAEGTDNVYLPDNASWSSQIAGFVISNSGSITNSRVGGDEVIVVGAEKQVDGESTGYTYASTQTLDTFHIVGQGNIAGFVLTNSGYITSSFVKNIDMENQSNSISFYTAGFAGTNNNSILTSYVEGTPDSDEDAEDEETSPYSFEGSSIRSSLGYIVGFIYNNAGSIKDSYSNILIANSLDSTRVYYASGFVYENEGTVENCYSASQISNSKYSQMNFSGVNENGDLLKSGEYINCYFFNKDYLNSEDPNDFTTETQYGTGAQLISKPSELSAYYGFAIADGEEDGIWRADDQRGITLIEANKTTISNRYTLYVDADSFEGVTGEDSTGRKYILPYSVLVFVDTSREIDTSLGGEYNPILISDAQDFVEISGTSTSTYVQQYFNENAIWGSYRLVSNINLIEVANDEDTVVLPSSNKAFAGRFYGNGFSITNISISADNSDVSFGLFASIESRLKTTPLITNLDLVLSQVIAGDVVMVGGLAGYIKDAIIINVDLNFESETSMVTGLNFVGGLAGFASGNNIIKNINVTNPTAKAERRADADETDKYFKSASEIQLFRTRVQNNLNYNTTTQSPFIKELAEYSYAGSLIGFVDNYSVDSKEFDINKVSNISINNIRVSGKVDIQGQIIGGIMGFTGYQTNVRDIGITFDATEGSSKLLSTKYFAGGVIGQSFGGVSRTFATYDETTQDAIEDNMAAFYTGNTSVERGQLDIFSSGTTNYTQEYIGGLIGYVGSGKLEISYSKLNVVSTSAKYAGGVIGGIEVSDALTYKVDTNRVFNEETYTRYLMHEVYATGDVRADVDGEGYAGGVIGVIKGKGSRVALLAVNAYNYFTTYDYDSNTYISLGETVKNMSYVIRANSIVGHFVDEGTVDNVTEKTYTNYITLAQAAESTSDGSSISIEAVPSVGYYEGYYQTSAGLVTVNMFSNLDGRLDISTNNLYKSALVYGIARPSYYTNSSVGHTYTQAGFINSGVWSSDTWVHNSSDLFPKIRYKRSYEVLYLDKYNVQEIFEKMSTGNSKVIVRGRINAEDEACADIDLRTDYFEKYNTSELIVGFSGILEGGGGKTTEGEKTRDVKIITDRTFIASTGPGFSINNLTIDFVKTDEQDENIEITNGLLSQSQISEGSISKLVLNIEAPVSVDLDKSSDNIGLIAPVIQSTSLSGVTINAKDKSKALLLATSDEDANADDKTVKIGLLAGELQQESNISSMTVNGIELDVGDLISVSGTGTDSKGIDHLYIGTYFGSVKRSADKQPLRITLNKIAMSASDGSVSDETSMIMTNISSNDLDNLYLGGYIGYSEGVDSYTYDDKNDMVTNIDYVISSAKDLTNASVYVGGVIAVVDKVNINGADVSAGTEVKSILYMDLIDNSGNKKSVNNLYAGGIVAGQPESSGALKINSFNTIDFEVVGSDAKSAKIQELKSADDYPDKQSLAGNYDGYSVTKNGVTTTKTARYAKVSGKARVGVVAGYSVGEFTFTSNSTLNNFVDSSTTKGRAIRLTGTDLAVGSVLGEAQSDASITGSILSHAEFMIRDGSSDSDNNSDKIVVGGMIGYSKTGNVIIKNNDTSSIIYEGAVYSNSQNLIFGGMLGHFEQRSNGQDYIQIQNTAFGGVVKLYGDATNEANVTIGGTVGDMDMSSVNVKAVISANYNYGDVFVEYGSGTDTTKLTALSSYVFGGLIGETSVINLTDNTTLSTTNTLNPTLSGNYSIVTSHNSRYSTVNSSTAHALFGNGNPFGTNNASSNYYNHAASLLIDELGEDIGYTNQYTSTNYGYADNFSSSANIVSTIKNKVDNRVVINNGHKLSPASLLSMSSEDKVFNGIKYYNFAGMDRQVTLTKGSETIKEFSNIAIIGYPEEYSYKTSDSLIETLSGYSSISGLALNIEITEENAIYENSKTYAPLIANMKGNTIVYAINVKGSYELGGANSSQIAGIVGNFESGKIFDSSTDIDIVYRAGGTSGGNVFGFANATGDAFKVIENSFTGGSITTMSNVNIYAFTKGNSNTNIRNSYTYTKIDPDNYLSTDAYSGTVDVFGDSGTSNCYYDIDGLNYVVTTTNGDATNRSSLMSLSNIFGDATSYVPWSSDCDFNYGYPTMKYNYLKVSSFAELDSTKYQCTHADHESETENSYDCYVETNTYTRLANGQKPETEGEDLPTYYYIVPNGAVLFDTNVYGNYNIALRYDIDLSIYNDTESAYNKSNSNSFYGDEDTLKKLGSKLGGAYSTFTFDGQGKTINGLERELFNSISGGTVRNLRLTDVNLSNIGVLGSEISGGSTVSNLTLSGHVKYTTNSVDGYGSIAGNINGATINTTTNMIELQVNVTGQQQNRVGGLFGIAQGGANILYCSNFGPVRLYHSTDYTDDDNTTINAYDDNIGGLVGLMKGSSTISYSYNSASVLGNYASATAIATTKGQFVTGGLVGWMSSGTIANSYNSGMVKSGNKSNVIVETLSGSIAGGIVGNAVKDNDTTTVITSCYNEGTVEALGVNPSWRYEIDEKDDEKDKDKLILKTTDEVAQNVYAYSIGKVTNSVNLNNNISKFNEDDFDSIKHNGCAFAGGTVLKTWEYTTIDALGDATDNTPEKVSAASWKNTVIFFFRYDKTNTMSEVRVTQSFDSNAYDASSKVLNLNTDSQKKSTYAYITSYNELGIPNRLIMPTKIDLEMDHEYVGYNWFGDDDYEDTINTGDEINTIYGYQVCDYSMDADFTVGGSKLYNKNITENVNCNEPTGTIVGDGSTIKQATRSKEEDSATPTVYKIGGTNYYLAETNNPDTIFNAGTYSDRRTATFTVPYISSTSYYKLTAPGTGLNCKIISITPARDDTGNIVNNSIDVEFDIYTNQDPAVEGGVAIPAEVNLKIELDYSENVIFGLTSMSYNYVDNYSIGIEIKDLKASPMSGYELTSSSLSTTYDTVYKLSTVQYNNTSPLEPIDNEDPSFVYLAAVNGKYIYIPNAQLNYCVEDANGNKTTLATYNVNVSDVDISKDGKINKENVQQIISKFAGKTFYSRYQRTDKTEFALGNKLTGYYNASTKITASQEKTLAKQTLTYGKEISTTTSDFSVVFNTEEKAYLVTLPSKLTVENMLAINVDPVFGYDFNSSSVILGSTSTVSIGGTTYTLSISDNKIKLVNASITSESTTVINNIKSYFNSLTYIVNDFSSANITISDQFADVTSGAILLNSGGTQIGKINKTIIKTWYLGSTALNEGTNNKGGYIITKTGNDIKISLNQNSVDLTRYQIGNVSVCKGALPISQTIKQKYTTTLGSAEITAQGTSELYTYYSLDLHQNTTLVCQSSGIIKIGSGAHGTSLKNPTDNSSLSTLSGEYELSLTLYNTYQEKSWSSAETGEYKLALEDTLDNNQYYVEIEDDLKTMDVYQMLDSDVYEDSSKADTDGIVSTTIKMTRTPNTDVIQSDGSTKACTEVTFHVNDERVSLLIREYEDKVVYVTYEDSGEKDTDGNVILNEKESTVRPSTITIRVLDSAEYKDVVINTNLLFSVYDKEFNKALSRTTNDGKSYVYSPKFKIIDSMSWTEKEMSDKKTVTEKSRVVSANFDWNQLTGPQYSEIKQTSKIDTSIIDNINDSTKAYISATNNSLFTTSGFEISVYLKGGDSETITLFIDKEALSENDSADAVTTKLDEAPIILTKDISFNASSKPLINNVNVIGSGYYISYYDSLYESLDSNGNFFRDLYLLGDSYNAPMLNAKVADSSGNTALIFNNVKFYGTVNNLESSDVVISAEASSSMKSVDSYVSVNGTTAENTMALLGNSNLESEINNYGTLIGSDGVNGTNGTNGGLVVKDMIGHALQKATEGTSGTAGQTIQAAANTTYKLENKGIVISGNGGNAGAGGSGLDNAEKGAKAGDAGIAGNIVGFGITNQSGTWVDQYTTKGTSGETALSGAKARGAFGLYYERDWSHEYCAMVYEAWGDKQESYFNYWIKLDSGKVSMKAGDPSEEDEWDVQRQVFDIHYVLVGFMKDYIAANADDIAPVYPTGQNPPS